MNEQTIIKNQQTIIALLAEIRDLLKNQPAAGSQAPAVQTNRFRAETMAATVDQGKVYWKVKGGRFRKHGLVVWPEVLTAAGFNPGQMDVMKTHDLTGWVVTYTTGETNRVTELVKQPAGNQPSPSPARSAGQPGQQRPAVGSRGTRQQPSFFRAGDAVKATDKNGKTHNGTVSELHQDQTITVSIAGKPYRLPVSQVEMITPA